MRTSNRDRRGGGRSRDFGRGGYDGGGRRDFRGGRDRNFGGGDRQMHSAICDECGTNCEVPFRPSGDKPIYCDSCFGKNKPQRNDNFDKKPRFEGKSNKDDFKSLNKKLDRILEILESTKEVKPAKETVKEAEERPAKETAKKTTKKNEKDEKESKKPAKKATKKVAKKPAKKVAKKTTKKTTKKK